VTVREAIALCGACVWGPALFLLFLPDWPWAALAGTAGLVVGLAAGWVCGDLLCRADGAACGPNLLALSGLVVLMGLPLLALWLRWRAMWPST
jgi:hypothetical protein